MDTVSHSQGIAPAQAIDAMIAAGTIRAITPFMAGQVQPASLDLRLGATAYRIRASFLPGPAETVTNRLEGVKLHAIDITQGAVLEVGCVYLVPLQESVCLPTGVSAVTNPKSSTGRLDVFTRVITDGSSSFDRLPTGYEGPLWAEISPRTFPVLVRQGSRLSQIRFRRGSAILSVDEMTRLQAAERLVDTDTPDLSHGIAVTVDLSQDGAVGYRAKRHTGVIDVDAVNACTISDFWESVHAKNRQMVLDPGEFYILASREAVHVPPAYAAEMVPFDPLVGEFRVHYAGFFDPGFGHASAGGSGSRAVLEVRSHEIPFILEHGQTVGRLVYEHLSEQPHTLYGQQLGSNYQAQGLKLSKHFKTAAG
jgi:dCTP deaminase